MEMPLGPAGVGYVILDENYNTIYQNYNAAGWGTTQSTVEFLALLYGLKSASKLGIRKLSCFGNQ